MAQSFLMGQIYAFGGRKPTSKACSVDNLSPLGLGKAP